MKLRNVSKLAIVAANCLGLAGLSQAAPSGAGISHMGSPAGIHQTMTSSSERSGDDRKERRQEHIEQLRERRQEHIEQLRERREDRADSSTTRTGTHIKN